MIELDYLQSQLDHLVRQRADACDTFLRTALDDRAKFEQSIRRMFEAAVEFLYVGTVPRGLAGSTSDIDILVLLEGADGQLPMPMIQHRNGKRVGVQTMDLRLLYATIDELNRWVACGHIPDAQEIGTLKVSLKMLERAVNGINFDGLLPMKEYLPTFAEIIVRIEAGWLFASAVWAKMAGSARRVAAAEGYWRQAGIHARECVMAVGGEVQANRKWVGERWHRYLLHAKPARISSMIELVEKMCSYSRCGDSTAAFACVSALLDSLGADIPGQINPVIAHNVILQDLTGQATILGGNGRAICVLTETLGAILADRRSPVDEFGEAEASVILEMAQLGMLQIAPLGIGQGEGVTL